MAYADLTSSAEDIAANLQQRQMEADAEEWEEREEEQTGEADETSAVLEVGVLS